MKQEFSHCRILGHAWIFTRVWKSQGNWVQGRECTRCRTTREVVIQKGTGKILGSSYKYPNGYQVKGGVDRAALLMSEIENQK